MLRVDTYLKNIEGKGISLISNEKIKKGDTVWVFDPMLDIIIPSSIVKSIKKTDHSGNFTKLIETYSAYDKTKDADPAGIAQQGIDRENGIPKHYI